MRCLLALTLLLPASASAQDAGPRARFAETLARVRAARPDLGADRIVRAGIDGMLRTLDARSDFVDPQMFVGGQAGIGISVSRVPDGMRVADVSDDGPAARAGLKRGDLIVALDDAPTSGLTLDEFVAALRGSTGSHVALTYRRAAGAESTIAVERAVVPARAVQWSVSGTVGIVALTSLPVRTSDQLAAAFSGARKSKPELTGFILDLRGNTGGLLDQAIATADLFLESGPIMSQRGRSPADVQRYSARRGDIIDRAPLVVLIDAQTAAGAEIVAAALQDNRRARIVGVRSLGAGTVQTLIPINAAGALRLTTSRVFTAAGRDLDGTGVTPDFVIDATAGEADIALATALQLLAPAALR